MKPSDVTRRQPSAAGDLVADVDARLAHAAPAHSPAIPREDCNNCQGLSCPQCSPGAIAELT